MLTVQKYFFAYSTAFSPLIKKYIIYLFEILLLFCLQTMNMKNCIISLITLTLLSSFSFSQEKWDLQQCVDQAIKNNLQVKQAELQTELNEENYNQFRAAALPSISANGSHVYNYGQTIDRYTNQFANQRVQSDNVSLSGNMNLFNGLQNYNRQQQGKMDYMASKYDTEKMKNDISLNVISAYLEVIFSMENITVVTSQLNTTQQQLDRTIKLVNAGSAPKGNQLDLEAQVARESLNLINAENRLSMAKLNLSQLMLVDSKSFDIVVPSSSLPLETMDGYNPDVVYNSAITGQPDIKAAEMRVKSAHKGISLARSGYSPNLNLFGSISSGYSGLAQEAAGNPVYTGMQTIGTTASGEPVLTPSFDIPTQVIPFGKQLDRNFNQTIGLQLQIPIFSQFANKINVNKAKINKSNAEIGLERTKQQLRQTIERSYNDANAAFKSYNATQKSLEALQEAFKYSEQRFNVGMINSVEFNQTKNQLNQAQSQLIQSKFDYIFKVKILDFYLGKPLNF